MAVPVVSFIGWSGVGKTTYLEALIPVLKARGLRVGLIKHDGHDFQMDREGKDTWRFTRAGAELVAISNDRHSALLENRPVPFAALLEKVKNVDIIIAEGFEQEPLPQVEVHRAGFSTLRAKAPERLLAIVSDEPLDTDAPVLAFDALDEMAELLCPMDAERRACRAALEELKERGDASGDVSVTVDGQDIPLLPFVQTLFRQVNQGLLDSLRDIPDTGDVTIRIRRS